MVSWFKEIAIFFIVFLNYNTLSLAFNYPVGSSKRCVVINVHFIQKLVTHLKSSFQDELQEFFSEFGPVHQLNILRDKTSGVSRQKNVNLKDGHVSPVFQGVLFCHLLQPSRCPGGTKPTSQRQDLTRGESKPWSSSSTA